MTVSMSTATILKTEFPGGTGIGPIYIDGLQVGDVIVALVPDSFMNWFEQVVSVDGQLQQTLDHDGSSVTFTAYLIRGV